MNKKLAYLIIIPFLFAWIYANGATVTKGLIGEQDLERWNGITSTFTRSSSTGGTLTLNKVGYEVDVLMEGGGGVSYTSTAINTIITSVGSTNNVTLVLRPGTWVMNANVTTTSNITLKVVPGATITTTGFTLTLNGPFIAGRHKIFTGTGTVSGLKESNVIWWGGEPDGTADFVSALQAAEAARLAGGTLIIPEHASTVFYNYDNATGGSASATTISKSGTVRISGRIKQTGFAHQANPASIFIISASSVTIDGGGTGILQGPDSSYDTNDSAYDNMTALIKVSANNFKVRGVKFVDPPQISLGLKSSSDAKIDDCDFTGGQAIAIFQTPANINHFHVYGYQTNNLELSNNRFFDDGSGHTVSEAVFIYDSDSLKIHHNRFQNIADHDLYLNHGGTGPASAGVNYSIIDSNISYSTLAASTEKLGSSFKVQGSYNTISNNNIYNQLGGLTIEAAEGVNITGNTIKGFKQGGIVVTDLVADNTAGINAVNINNNILIAHSDAVGVQGIGLYGHSLRTPAAIKGGKITGNTIVGCGSNVSTVYTSIYVSHDSTSYYASDFLVSSNIIKDYFGICAISISNIKNSRFERNIITSASSYAGSRGFYAYPYVINNVFDGNTIRDDQASPVVGYGIYYSSASDTDNKAINNIFHSNYASRSTNPWGMADAYRNDVNRNIHNDTFGYPLALRVAEGTAVITSAPTVGITTSIPIGARIRGIQLRVESDLAAGDLWDAQYVGGILTSIGSTHAVAKNTKASVMYNENAASPIASAATNVLITKSGGGLFTAQGIIRALVYYEFMATLGDAP